MNKKVNLNEIKKSHDINKAHKSINYSTASNQFNNQKIGNQVPNEDKQDNTTAGKALSNYIKNSKAAAYVEEAKIVLKRIIIRKVIKVALIIFASVAILFLPIFIVLILAGGSGSGSSGSRIATKGYYEAECSDITVKFVDNNYEVTETSTYSLKDYVAGVVAAEVPGANNIEVYKTFAIAARTYGLGNQENCSIESSSRKQNFKDVTDDSSEDVQMIYEAVEETEGIVLLDEDGKLKAIQYDAFCYVDKDDNYYTLSQQNQKVPLDWVENNVGNFYYKNCPCNLNDQSMTECWDSNGQWLDGGHGNGMSQIGSYYLAKELNYTYDQIIDYYYGDQGVTISKKSFVSSIAGLDIKATTGASYTLDKPITDYLSSTGSNVDDYNSFIKNNVENAGVGTRAGVVTAAVSMINYLYDNFNTKLPYYWGGSSQIIGIPSDLGSYSPSSTSRGGNINYYKSFDCSGFVSWSIRNGGYNFSRRTTVGFDNDFSSDSCLITDESCIGQPGDLINSYDCHVQMIVSVDEETNKYYVAESTGDLGVIMRQWNMHSENCGERSPTKILHMDSFYNNASNVDTNY